MRRFGKPANGKPAAICVERCLERVDFLRMTTLLDLPTPDDLERYVHATLCELDHLDLAQSPLKRRPLVKKGSICGTMFNVEGPRLLRTSAVWAADEGRILFYDSTGQRALEVKLGESPEAETIIAGKGCS